MDTWTFRRYWPDQPALEYPAERDTVADPFFYQWTPVRLATALHPQVSPSPDFSVLHRLSAPPSTPRTCRQPGPTAPRARPGTFYWRVVATDAPGVTRDRDAIRTDVISAEVRQFTYDPVMPRQVSPAAGEHSVTVPDAELEPGARRRGYKVTITALSGRHRRRRRSRRTPPPTPRGSP